jgi:hypothetical protein
VYRDSFTFFFYFFILIDTACGRLQEENKVQVNPELYNILTQFDLPIKVVRLAKMCVSETCSKVSVSIHLCCTLPVQNGLNKECFVTVAFEHHYRTSKKGKEEEYIHHYAGKARWKETTWKMYT